MTPENHFSIILFGFSFFTILTGYWFKNHPPKSVNWFYGFRTKNTMKSQLHWGFAHLYSGKLFLKYGLLLFILGCIGLFLNLGEVTGPALAIPFFIMGSFYVVYRTEKAIIKKFKS